MKQRKKPITFILLTLLLSLLMAGTALAQDDEKIEPSDDGPNTPTHVPASPPYVNPAAISFPSGAIANPGDFNIPDNDPGNPFCNTVNVTHANIPVGSTLSEVTVDIAMEHTWVGDIRVELTSPMSTTLDIYNRPGRTGGSGSGDSSNLSVAFPLNFADANVVDAETMGAVEGGADNICEAAPNECAFSPNPDAGDGGQGVNFADFNGEDPNGDWTLCIFDNATGDTGTLTSWTLNLAGQNPTALAVQSTSVEQSQGTMALVMALLLLSVTTLFVVATKRDNPFSNKQTL